MKLTAKLILFLTVAIMIAMAVNGYVSVRREVQLFDQDMQQHALALGSAMRSQLVDARRTGGLSRAMQLIADANAGEHLVHTRWVWLDASPDSAYSPRLSPQDLEPVVHGHLLSVKRPDRAGGGFRYTYIPLAAPPDRPAALEMSESLAHLNDYTWATVERTALTTLAIVIFGGVLVMLAGSWLVGRPLVKLTEKARRVGTGDLSSPLRIPGHDELSDLAMAMNTMCEHLAGARERVALATAAQIEALEQLRHVDRLQTAGRLASGIAHEVGTPLNVISGRAVLIASGVLTPAEIAESSSIIRTQADRITMLIQEFLEFARRRPPLKTRVDVEQIARETLDLLAPMAAKNNATFSLGTNGGPVTVHADAGKLEQVLTNLVVNAVQAMPGGGKIEVSIDQQHLTPPEDAEAPEGEYVGLHVRDEGDGIRPEVLPHIFEPFFTTKDVGEGTGLGLSIAYGIIREHGGWIAVSSKPGSGSRFSAYLPKENQECTDES